MCCDFWTTPISIERTEGMKTVYDLLYEYKDFLDGTDRLESFEELCCDKPEAARAEAVAYSFFKSHGYNIQVEETPNEGGVDFRVQAETTDFVVEVTSIRREIYTKHSGMSERIESGRSRSVSPYKVPHLIRSQVSGKAKQMSGYDCPRILVITCEHPEYAYFIDNKGVLGPAGLLTSPPKISIPGGNNVTELEDSLFFRFNKKNGRIVFCRESISAVLLFHISKYNAEAVGLLHPRPAHTFSIEHLPLMPFVEVSAPEIEDYSIRDFYRIDTKRIPDNLPEGLFVYNQWR